MLKFTDLSLRRGPRLLLENVNLQVHPGQKAGVTGANGSGKSSLFSLVLGELGPDAGEVGFPADWVVAHVAQETPTDRRAAIEYVLDGDAELRHVEGQLAAAEASGSGERLANLHARFEAIDGYTARSRAGRLLHGLGFTAEDESRPVAEFSGGWRMRLNLARALMCRSSLLLLDEPTNHLDLDAVIWLEGWLRGYPGTLLLISHDRDFLDAVVDRIVHLEHGTATLYTGNYSDFERVRAERLAHQQAQYRKQQREVAHMQAFIERFRAKASKARQAQSRIKALERMQVILPAHVDSPFRFSLREPVKTPNPLLRLDGVAAGYGDTTVLSGLRLTLSPGDRLGLLGHNGAGKSTLVKLLAGLLPVRQGECVPAADLAVGYFAQHQVDQLDPDRSPLEHLAEIDPAARELDLRTWLGGFGFSGDAVFRPTAPFSGGEKSRLALALLVYRRPNLLLLDEPTNHLDIDMRQALANALQEFAGAMVIVSHDRHLLRVTTDGLLLVNAGSVTEFDGSLDDYPAWLAGAPRPEPAAPRREAGERGGDAKARRRRDAEQRQALRPLNRRIEKAELALARLQAERTALEERLADAALYEAAKREELQAVLEQQADNRWALAKEEAGWLEACEELERAAAALDYTTGRR
ncbi:MAG TPA: ATP-binding cassette domain-containing protein [Woeseiaceae bacterium]|nr:ATP-binding cassette domain-containing protein [Woeseiaceae bacterium]